MWLESEGKVLVEKDEGVTHVNVEGTNLELEKLEKEYSSDEYGDFRLDKGAVGEW